MKKALQYLIILLSLYFQASLVVAQAVLFEENDRFHPVVSKTSMVASQEAHASQVGRDVLKQGGNAVDAAVAMGFSLAVTLPRAGNLGGGGFMLLWLNKSKKMVAIDFRETAPSAASRNMFLDENGEVNNDRLHDSYLSSGIPGTVAGLTLARDKYGSKPLSTLILPAINLAAGGFPVSPGLARAIHSNKDRLSRSVETKKIFFKKQGKEYEIGDLLKQTDLAKSLRLIAHKGPAAFYKGEIAKQLVKVMHDNGGIISQADLKNYKAEIVEPINGSYHGYKIYSMPPPSSGGITMIQILNILEPVPLKQFGFNSAKSIHYMAEAMNLAYRDRNKALGDPAFIEIPYKRLLSKAYAKKLLQSINPTKHTKANLLSSIVSGGNESHQTTHYSVIDKEGNMVAVTYTLNYSFGNALVIPKTGILLNNEMDDFSAKPGTANSFGLIQGEANSIQPGKRPLSSMAPTIILDSKGKPMLATGTPGGPRIITTNVQLILNMLEHNLNLATATSMPRMHSQLWPDKIYLEQGVSYDTQKLLQDMGHDLQRVPAMGSVQSVMQGKRYRIGFSDPRRAGALAIGN